MNTRICRYQKDASRFLLRRCCTLRWRSRMLISCESPTALKSKGSLTCSSTPCTILHYRRILAAIACDAVVGQATKITLLIPRRDLLEIARTFIATGKKYQYVYALHDSGIGSPFCPVAQFRYSLPVSGIATERLNASSTLPCIALTFGW